MKEYDIEKIMKEHGSVGAVVKETDYAFTNLSRRTSEYGDFDRIGWQFIHYLFSKENVSIKEIKSFLHFFEAQEEKLNDLIDDFESKGLIKVDNGVAQLTPDGKKAFEAALEIQQEIITKAFDSISEEDYITTMNTLRKMVENTKEYVIDPDPQG